MEVFGAVSLVSNENQENKKEMLKSNRVSGTAGNRRAFQVLQPTASTQTSLVGGKIMTPSVGGLKHQIQQKVKSKPERDFAVSQAPEPKTRDAEVQTELTGATGKLDNAEEIAWITSRTGNAQSIRKVVEWQISEIEELMTKNEEFRRENDSLRIEIDAGREKNIELLKVVEEIGESYTQIQDELNTPSAEEPQQ